MRIDLENARELALKYSDGTIDEAGARELSELIARDPCVVSLVAEATFDRSPTSHRVNLFELDQKYATVIGVETARSYLGGG